MRETEATRPGAPELECLDRSTPAELLEWRPAAGVFSVYVEVDPGQRGGRRRIELRDDLDRAIGAAGRNGRDPAELIAAAARIEETVALLSHQASGRGIVGFVDAGPAPAEERWFTTQLPPLRTEAHLAESPVLAPLLALVEEGAPSGVAVVSSECVRLFDWHLGQLEQIQDWELEVFSLDWRERKAPGPGNNAGSGASAAGHDQYRQRMDHNRDAFARETGVSAREEGRRRDWEQILVFGDPRHTTPFCAALGEERPVLHVEHSDLISQPTHLIAERVDRAVPEANRDRQRALVERLKDAAFAGGRAALGPQETRQSLEEGRVERLVYDARLDGSELERMISLAASSGATVLPVEGVAAAELAEQDGVAAVLRY